MSRPLLEEAQRVARGNQRITVRYRCAPATTGKLYVAKDQVFTRAWIVNVSKKGIGLTLAHSLPPGTFVILQIRSVPDGKMRDLQCQVVHATTLTPTEWLIGCELLEPLSEDELDELL